MRFLIVKILFFMVLRSYVYCNIVNMSKKYIIVGLGNYLPEYRFTRHNIGSDFLEWIASKLRVRNQKHFVCYDSVIDNKEIFYIIPKTNMNTSGVIFSDENFKSFYKNGEIEKTLILHDDLDVEFQKIKLRTNPERSHRGHNGNRSILETMKNQALLSTKKNYFPFFLSIGIGRPLNSQETISSWVLKKYTTSEQEVIKENIFPAVERSIFEWLNN